MTARSRGQTVVTAKPVGLPTIRPAPARAGSVRLTPHNLPPDLQRYLAETSKRIDDLTQKSLANVFGGGTALRGNSLTSGVPTYLKHRLGRAYVGFFATRIYSLGSPPGTPTLFEVALPSGMSSTVYLPVQCTSTGIYDIFVF